MRVYPWRRGRRLRVPNALGVLEDQIAVGPIQGKFHVVSVRVRFVLVHGGNFQTKFATQRKRGAGDAGRAVVAGFAARAVTDGFFGAVALFQVRVGEERHAADRVNVLGVLFEIEQALPDDIIGGGDLEDDKAAALLSHFGLFLDAFVLRQELFLLGGQCGERKGQGFDLSRVEHGVHFHGRSCCCCCCFGSRCGGGSWRRGAVVVVVVHHGTHIERELHVRAVASLDNGIVTTPWAAAAADTILLDEIGRRFRKAAQRGGFGHDGGVGIAVGLSGAVLGPFQHGFDAAAHAEATFAVASAGLGFAPRRRSRKGRLVPTHHVPRGAGG